MKINNILISTICLGALVLGGCSKVDDFLNEEPSKNTLQAIESLDQLDAVLASYGVYPVHFFEEKGDMLYSSDDFGFLTKLHDQKSYSTFTFVYGLWNNENAIDDRYPTWNGEYTKAFYANLVLDYVDKLPGDEKQKALLKADASFLRAYCFFTIALAHTLYYDGSNGDELGITLKKTSSFEEDITRASLKETWDFIENDLQEALKITKPFVREDGKRVNWRGSTGSVHAFAARYYLYRADYAKAKQYALEALKECNDFIDYNDPKNQGTRWDLSYTLTDTGEDVAISFPDCYQQLVTYWGMEPNMEYLLSWKELFYARTAQCPTSWLIPSQDLLDTYKEDVPRGDVMNDLRYKRYMINFGTYTISVKSSDSIYPGYVNFMGDVLSGPTVGEMYLILAECAAREGNTTEAMKYLNTLRKNRIAKEVYTDLTASSASVALKKVLQERRREMPFSIRWYDLKRLNATDPDNKVTIKRTFYQYNNSGALPKEPLKEYVLEPNSRRYAIPLSKTQIEGSKGLLEQNKY